MNRGTLRTQFKAILNRRDCTDALANTFIDQALQRAQRDMRTPPQEQVNTITVTNPFSGITVPSGLMEVISINAEYGGTAKKITYLPYDRFLEEEFFTSGFPLFWTRKGSTYLFKPTPVEGMVINLYYWGEFESFPDDVTETAISAIAPDLIIYGALSYAADYFVDERAERFESRYMQLKQDVQDQAYSTDGTSTVCPPHTEY